MTDGEQLHCGAAFVARAEVNSLRERELGGRERRSDQAHRRGEHTRGCAGERKRARVLRLGKIGRRSGDANRGEARRRTGIGPIGLRLPEELGPVWNEAGTGPLASKGRG